VFELIKSEMLYKKWTYLTLLIMPFLMAAVFWWMFFRLEKFDRIHLAFSGLIAFGATLLINVIRTPQVIHQTSVEENRIQLFAALPISVRMIAMSQSLPFLLVTACLTLLGMVTITTVNLGAGLPPFPIMVNAALAMMALGMFSLLLKELFVILPKWSVMVFWALFFGGLIVWRSRVEPTDTGVFLVEVDVMAAWSTSGVLALATLTLVLGHLALFTHLHTDLSQRRRHP